MLCLDLFRTSPNVVMNLCSTLNCHDHLRALNNSILIYCIALNYDMTYYVHVLIQSLFRVVN